MKRRACLVILSLTWALASAGAPTRAFADDAPPAAVQARARALYNEGVAAFEKGDYKLAIEKYLAANEAWPRPNFLYNIAQAYRLAGERRKAIRYYRSFVDATPNAPYAPAARERITELEAELAREDAEARERAAATAPAPRIPSPEVAAQSVEPGGPAPLVVPTEEPSSPVYQRWWFWTAVGGAAVLTTVMIVVAGSSHGVNPPSTSLGTTSAF